MRLSKNNLHRAPMFTGVVKGVGPRYCPSIEDKIVRFADKERHQLFLEPEGRNTEEVYVQGLSTSLPEDVQRDLVHSIKGLENAEMMRTGYAIEYDMVLPHQLRATLETKKISGLFTAGRQMERQVTKKLLVKGLSRVSMRLLKSKASLS